MKINKAKTSKISNVDFDNLTFGKHFTDHMFICDYNNNSWNNARIVPYKNIEISPSARVFHYGQAIFEGMKATKIILAKFLCSGLMKISKDLISPLKD